MNHAVIAGYGPGMGAALARRFAGEGYTISLLARGRAALDEAVTRFADQGVIARGFEVDLSQPPAIRTALAEVAAATGALDVLIDNAARWRAAATMALLPQDFAQDLSLAVTGALVRAQSVYPAMRVQGSGTMLFTSGGLALSRLWRWRCLSDGTKGRPAWPGLCDGSRACSRRYTRSHRDHRRLGRNWYRIRPRHDREALLRPSHPAKECLGDRARLPRLMCCQPTSARLEQERLAVFP